MKFTTLYFAYGANTNIAAMAKRCPKAQPIGMMRLDNYRLVFRGVADVEPAPGDVVIGALWSITDECEAALDRFEGFPTLYTKLLGTLNLNGQEHDVMLYVMTDQEARGTGHPSPFYEQTLREGYAAFGIPEEQLDAAIEAVEGTYARHGSWGQPRRRKQNRPQLTF